MTDRAALLRCMVVGDIIGKPGRQAITHALPELRRELDLDMVIANGENLAAGAGLTPSLSEELLGNGVDVITSGNHIWDKREVYDYLDSDRPVLRPMNYPDDAPGRGWLIHDLPDGGQVAVMNAMGRVFMNQLDSPFTAMDALLDGAAEPLPPVRILDFHCEITSEKNAMGWYLDGRVTAVVGTHTHVPTADARVLPKGTAYISDIGMTGSARLDHRLQPGDRPAALPDPPAHPLQRGRWAGQPERGGRSRPSARPGGRARSSRCSA